MNTLSKKQQIIEQLKNDYPQLLIKEVYDGSVLEISENSVLTRIYVSDGEEYECEFRKHIFPSDGLSENVIFLLVIGDLHQKDFIHVNYFFWTQEEIDEAKRQAEDLIKFLKFE